MPTHVARGNPTRAGIRARVEHVFTEHKRRLNLIVRTVNLARAKTKITLANLVFNVRKLSWLEGRGASVYRSTSIQADGTRPHKNWPHPN